MGMMHTFRSRHLLLLAFCLHALLPALCTSPPEALNPTHASTQLGTDPTGEHLINWLRSKGATVKVKVGPAPDTGLRGTIATEDIPAGELVIAVPAALSIQLGSADLQGAELAVDVLRLRLGDPGWTAQLGPYWASLPAQGTLFSKEAWSADYLDLLQDPGLAEFVMHNTDYTESVVYPELGERLRGFPGAQDVTLEEFRHWATLVAQYTYVFWNSTGPDRAQRRFMFPLGDLANHKRDGYGNSAAELDHRRGELVLVATRDIQAGEEVTHTYSRANDRNDYSLVNYFFTQELDPPRLCALDLPGEHPEDDDMGEPDSHYFGFHPDELEMQAYRMEQRLAAFHTSEEQDARLLARTGPSALSRIPRQIMTFRMLRKRALAAAIEELKAQAALAGEGAGAGSGWEKAGGDDDTEASQMSCSDSACMAGGCRGQRRDKRGQVRALTRPASGVKLLYLEDG